MRIDGSSALVAGGASGLGEATVRRLHASGASVTIADLDGERGRALAAELGERATFAEADVRDPEATAAAVAIAAAEAGGLRISVCCAGIGGAGRLVAKGAPLDLETFTRVVEVNLIGTFNVLRLAATAMTGNDPVPGRDAERGVCINTASIAAYEGQIGQVPYAASKGGIVGLTLPAARDLADHNVRVVTIAPGLFDTPLLAGLPGPARESLGRQVPYPPRLGDPAEYAELAAAIIQNPMINGETIRLDGALRMGPR